MAEGDDWRSYEIAKAAGAILRRGGVKVVFCDSCKTARMDGPEYCPKCGGVLRPIVKPPEEEKPVESSPPTIVAAESGLWVEVHKTGKLEFKGRSQTLEEWSKELGIPIKTIKNRITRRFPVERVLQSDSNPAPIERRLTGDVHEFTFQGETLTLQQWSQRLGIQYATLYDRVERGWSIERAFTEPLEMERVLEFNGKVQTITEWSAEIGVSSSAIRKRLAKGLSIEQVLTGESKSAAVDVVETQAAVDISGGEDELMVRVRRFVKRVEDIDVKISQLRAELAQLKSERAQIIEEFKRGKVAK